VGKWLSADNLYPLKAQYEIGPITAGTTITYQWTEEPFPLYVGKQVMYVEERREIVENNGEEQSNALQGRTTKLFTVESSESLTVPAGTFEVLKIVTTDETGNVTAVEWYSNQVKGFVKTDYKNTGDVSELISYSLQ